MCSCSRWCLDAARVGAGGVAVARMRRMRRCAVASDAPMRVARAPSTPLPLRSTTRNGTVGRSGERRRKRNKKIRAPGAHLSRASADARQPLLHDTHTACRVPKTGETAHRRGRGAPHSKTADEWFIHRTDHDTSVRACKRTLLHRICVSSFAPAVPRSAPVSSLRARIHRYDWSDSSCGTAPCTLSKMLVCWPLGSDESTLPAAPVPQR